MKNYLQNGFIHASSFSTPPAAHQRLDCASGFYRRDHSFFLIARESSVVETHASSEPLQLLLIDLELYSPIRYNKIHWFPQFKNLCEFTQSL
jgi:hypothetical protein